MPLTFCKLVDETLGMEVMRTLLVQPFARACAFIKQKGWCLQYKTSEVTKFLGAERDASEDLDYFALRVSFERLLKQTAVRP